VNAEPVARPHPEPVVLDIGGDLGALVVYADAALLDTPIEISREGQDQARAHQHVLERPLQHRTHHVAVFDQVIEGTYTLWLNNKPRATNVTITGGEVTELDWRSPNQI
jgi:hypothetical protein